LAEFGLRSSALCGITARVNETISSLLMNYIAIRPAEPSSRRADERSGFPHKPSSFPIPAIYKLGNIGDTRIHTATLRADRLRDRLFLIQHTTFGFAARTAGGNVKAARIAGLPVGKLTVIHLFLAVSCAGLAGMVEVAAVQSQANASIVAGTATQEFWWRLWLDIIP
jgi:simple sugar transport system permease protein